MNIQNKKTYKLKSSLRKVLITGVFSSGKTTTCQEVSKELDKKKIRNTILHDIGRECLLPINKKQTLSSSSWLFLAQITQESYHMFSPDNITNEIVICDRSLPDILSHTKFIFTETKEDDLLKRIMEQVTYVWLSSFDYIFYAQLSEELQIESDNIREVDRNFQEKLQSYHQEILKKSECRFHYLPTSIPDRVEFIMNFLIGD